ncbi:MAG: methyltransferase domain-containing protein [Chloroflexota bacterium]
MGIPPVCDYEGSDYQARFWEQGGRAYEDRAEAIALGRLLPPSGARLLELGAGAGRNTPRYAGFKQVVLLDYSRTQLQLARERLGASEAGTDSRYVYVAANIYNLPFVDGLFDAATMIRTLHHMADAPRALAQVRGALRSGAIFILEYANKQNLKAMLRHALKQQEWSPYSPEPVEFAALNFDFHPQAIRAWLAANRFTVQRQLTVSHFRFEPLKKLFPAGFLATLDGMASLTGDLWQLTPSVFVRAEATGGAEATGDAEATGGAEATDGGAAAGMFFRCPHCSAPLQQNGQGFPCQSCGRVWPIRDGIYDFKEPLA